MKQRHISQHLPPAHQSPASPGQQLLWKKIKSKQLLQAICSTSFSETNQKVEGDLKVEGKHERDCLQAKSYKTAL